MESHKDESKVVPEPRKEEGKRRFQIVKLEERIAPREPCYCHGHGHYKTPPGHNK